MKYILIALLFAVSLNASAQNQILVGKSLRVGPSGTYTKGRVSGFLNADSTSTVTLVSARVVTNEINKRVGELYNTIQSAALTTLTATNSLNFASVPAQSSLELPILVAGAAVGDVVAIGTGFALPSGHSIAGYVRSAGEVTIVYLNSTSSAYDPALFDVKVIVLK